MTASEQNFEWLTRKRLIDPKLKAAGWTVVPFTPGMSLSSYHNCNVTEFEAQRGLAECCSVQNWNSFASSEKAGDSPESVLATTERYL